VSLTPWYHTRTAANSAINATVIDAGRPGRYNIGGMPVYEISVDHAFRASHAITLPDGSLEETHEHHWQVTAAYRAEHLQPQTGVVVDFLVVTAALERICRSLAGCDLNAQDAFSAGAPSAERVAEYIAGRLADEGGGRVLHRVDVTEAPGCRATYYL